MTDIIDGNILNLKNVRRALRDWDLLSVLGESPLANLGIVLSRLRRAGYTLTTAGRGLALRGQLQAAIDLLKPEDGLPKPHEKRWRAYTIITDRYLNGRNPEYVQEKLHISRGTYFEEQNRALEKLADILLRMEEENKGFQSPKQPVPADHFEPKSQPPFLVPFYPTYFLVGRTGLLGELKGRLLDPRAPHSMALYGLPGAGKSRIAIELAHDPQIQEHFCDGILWAGLGRQPDVSVLLRTWATAFGIAAESLSRCKSLVEMSELIHTAVGLRRILFIIDDAWETESAIAFKVGGPNCVYLATSRQMGLALEFAGENVSAIHELEQNDGLELLLQIAPRALDAGTDEAVSLVRSAGGLPLALILIGRYLQKQSYGSQPRRLKDALARLKAAEARLNLSLAQSPLELNPGIKSDTPFSLKTIIGMSDLELDDSSHQALVSLSLFPPKPNSFSEEAALAVIDLPVDTLDSLVDCGLVETVKPDRYCLHQTIADYSSLFDPDPQAVERMLAYFVQFAETNEEAFQALELEFHNIQAALAIAIQSNQYKSLISLVNAIYTYLETRGLFILCEQLLSQVYQIGENLGDLEERAFILHWLGSFAVKRGRFKDSLGFLQKSVLLAQAARAHFLEGQNKFSLYGIGSSPAGEAATQPVEPRERFNLYGVHPGLASKLKKENPELPNLFSLYGIRSTSLAREARARALLAHNLNDLGITRMYMGYFIEGCAHMESALQIYRELELHQEEGMALNALGYAYQEICNYPMAGKFLDRALQICLDSNNQRGVGLANQNLSLICLSTGDFEKALEQSQKSLEIFIKVGDKRGKGWQIYHEGRILRQMGNSADAARCFQDALGILNEIGDEMGQAYAIQGLGLIKMECGEVAQAQDAFFQAQEKFLKIECKSGIFRFNYNMGVLFRKFKEPAEALAYLKRSLDIAREIIFPRGESAALAELGLVYLHLGETPLAIDHGQNAVRIAQNIGARPTLARAWLFLGHIFMEARRLKEAEVAYQQSLNLHSILGQKHLMAEPLNGLAELAVSI